MRFPALALALAAATPRGKALMPVVIVYVLVGFLTVTAYGALMARRAHQTGGGSVTPLRAVPRRA
jgi:predicted ATPase